MREALTRRFWVDDRRGWRYTNPNLEQLGLIEATYLSLDELAPRDEEFEGAPILRTASPNERASALRALLDVMCKGRSIDCDALDRLKIESLAGRMRSIIKAPWLLEDEGSLAAAVCDAQTVAPGDLVASDLIYPNRSGETYAVKYSPTHRWFYFPEMTVDEALLLKCYDSATDGRTRFGPHIAFVDPTTPPDAPPWESIELQTLVFHKGD